MGTTTGYVVVLLGADPLTTSTWTPVIWSASAGSVRGPDVNWVAPMASCHPMELRLPTSIVPSEPVVTTSRPLNWVVKLALGVTTRMNDGFVVGVLVGVDVGGAGVAVAVNVAVGRTAVAVPVKVAANGVLDAVAVGDAGVAVDVVSPGVDVVVCVGVAVD